MLERERERDRLERERGPLLRPEEYSSEHFHDEMFLHRNRGVPMSDDEWRHGYELFRAMSVLYQGGPPGAVRTIPRTPPC